MAERHLVLCGGARLSSRSTAWRAAHTVRLQLGKGKKHLHLQIHHITRALAGNIPPEGVDLLEIAAYVYGADQTCSRGGEKEFEYGNRWRRHFRFEIPVRRPDIWSNPAVLGNLTSALGFLSDDDYEFVFLPLSKPKPVDKYLFDSLGSDDSEHEEVMLFSGGLDSFGGAVQEILQGNRKVVLVSHRPAPQIYARQRHLVNDISKCLPDKSRRPLHVAVEVNKSKNFGSDFTQRTRSFLFAAIAAIIAKAFNRNRIRFYENGIVSLNLPISPQALGGRSTRTTHPQVLNGFESLMSAVFGTSFTVENPFMWKTKADVLREVKTAGFGKLCAYTSSCTHTRDQTKMHTHCGRCSQCVDRRLNALAAAFSNEEDPREMYASDVVTSPREHAELTLIERYIGTALEIDRISSATDFLMKYPEVSRVLRHIRMPAEAAAERVFGLYRRHARDICQTLIGLVSSEAAAIVHKIYPANCLLSLAAGRSPLSSPLTAQPAVSVPVHKPSSDGPPVADRNTFAVCHLGKSCVLRNTKEFALFERLLRRPGNYVSTATLAEDVWKDDRTEKNTIQRAASSLRRKLRAQGLDQLDIDGTTNKDHYALRILSHS